jgi:hypothetical protein
MNLDERTQLRRIRWVRRPGLAGLLLALALPALCVGCGTAMGDYGSARALDLLDVVPASLAVGYGASAQVRLSPYLGLGAGMTNNWRVGIGTERFGPFWFEKERGIPIWRYYRLQAYRETQARISGGDPHYYEPVRRYRASSMLVFPGMAREGQLWWPFYPPYFIKAHTEWPGWSFFELLNLEAGLFAGVIGARLTVSPLQLVDFVVGVFTFDPADDDPRTLRPLWPDPEAPDSFPDQEEAPGPPVADRPAGT